MLVFFSILGLSLGFFRAEEDMVTPGTRARTHHSGVRALIFDKAYLYIRGC